MTFTDHLNACFIISNSNEILFWGLYWVSINIFLTCWSFLFWLLFTRIGFYTCFRFVNALLHRRSCTNDVVVALAIRIREALLYVLHAWIHLSFVAIRSKAQMLLTSWRISESFHTIPHLCRICIYLEHLISTVNFLHSGSWRHGPSIALGLMVTNRTK